MSAPEVQRPQTMRICEECGANACLPDDWYCDDCIAEMMCGFEDREPAEPEPCSDCVTGTASVFGLCDSCYDLIYSTRQPYTGNRTVWTHTVEPEPAIPPFHEEVQHLRWTVRAPRKRVRLHSA